MKLMEDQRKEVLEGKMPYLKNRANGGSGTCLFLPPPKGSGKAFNSTGE